jgi:hypothetical protein
MGYHVKCVDDQTLTSPMYRPRATAGVAILWPQEISKQVTPLPDGSDRVVAIQVQTDQGPLVVINTYMPANGTHSGVDYN